MSSRNTTLLRLESPVIQQQIALCWP